MQLAPNDLSEAFFSRANLDSVQRRLIEAVKAKTGYTVDRQSDVELTGIMRGVPHQRDVADHQRLELVSKPGRGVQRRDASDQQPGRI